MSFADLPTRWGSLVADEADGLDMLQAKVRRRSRSVPPPRNPRDAQTASRPARAADDQGGANPVEEPADGVSRIDAQPTNSGPSKPRPPRPSVTEGSERRKDERPTTTVNEPVTNLAVRVRRSLDIRLGDIVHALKRDAVRASKVEIIEMLLWELPPEVSSDFRGRLAAFRQAAPREDSL